MAEMSELEVLARTIIGEAAREPRKGREAVAAVVMNRAHNPRWWGSTPRTVCLAPKQFSCWNKRDPARRMMLAEPKTSATYREAEEIARLALSGRLADPTGGADHYVNLAVSQPAWADPEKRTETIGAHTFFRLSIPAPDPEPQTMAEAAQTGTGRGAITAATATGAAGVIAAAAPMVEALKGLPPWLAAVAVVAVAAVAVAWVLARRRRAAA